jgi:hypothetical protein
VSGLVTAMRPLLTLLCFLAPLPVAAQLPVADLRASHVVLTEVPTIRPTDRPPLTAEFAQVVRLRIENLGPADVPDANVALTSFPGLLIPDLVSMSAPSACGITFTPTGGIFEIDWPIGILRAGQYRECDITLRSTGSGPVTPPPNGSATFSVIPTSSQTQPPVGFINFAGTLRRFTIAPSVAVLADYSVRFDPSPIRVDPGTSREVSLFITNRGPQAITAAQTRFYGWFERFNVFGPPPIPPDPFILSSVGGPECELRSIGPITSPPGPVELTAVIDPAIAPGETRECRIRIDARANASGERSLHFTQRIFYDGVVDPNLADNVATLRMIFTDPPAEPVPAVSRTILAVMLLMFAWVGLASLAREGRA